MTDPHLDQRAASFVSRAIDPVERIIWCGKPQSGIIFRPYDWFLVPFGVLWLGSLFFIAGDQLFGPHPDPAALFFLPLMLLIGSLLFFGRFFVDAWTRARTYYGVTNESIVFVYDYIPRGSRILSLRTLSEIAITERQTGRGNISFGSSIPWFYGGWFGWSPRHAPPVLENIDDVRAVYNQIRSAQRVRPA